MAVIVDNEFGSITIDNTVVAHLAGIVANESYGVVGMAVRNARDGLVSLLNPSNITKGIFVTCKDDKFRVALHIIVQYGVNINAICESIMHNVKYKLEEFTGFEVEHIDIYVESVRTTKD